MRLFRIAAIAFTLVVPFATSCAVEHEAPVAEQQRELMRSAQVTGSCTDNGVLYCGGKSKNGSCWCDDACVGYGDCCSDVAAVCKLGGGNCDPTLVCLQVITCVDGQSYPTACGPDNCDGPTGPCQDNGTASCEKQCGQAAADGSCYCDDVCTEYGDCCNDFSQVCM